MKIVTPKAGEIWEVLLDNGHKTNLKRLEHPEHGVKWKTLDGSIIPCRVYSVIKKVK